MQPPDAPRDFVKEHIDRIIQCYSDVLTDPPTRESYEQIRADLMIAVGMLMALHRPQEKPHAS